MKKLSFRSSDGMGSIYLILLTSLVSILFLSYVQLVNQSYLQSLQSLNQEKANYISESGILTMQKLVNVMQAQGEPITDAVIMQIGCQLASAEYESTINRCEQQSQDKNPFRFYQNQCLANECQNFSIRYDETNQLIHFDAASKVQMREQLYRILYRPSQVQSSQQSCAFGQEEQCLVITTVNQAPVDRFDRKIGANQIAPLQSSDVYFQYSQAQLDQKIASHFQNEQFVQPGPTPSPNFVRPTCSTNQINIDSNDLEQQFNFDYGRDLCADFVDVRTGRVNIKNKVYVENQLSLKGSPSNAASYMVYFEQDVITNNLWIYDINQYYSCSYLNTLCGYEGSGEHGVEFGGNLVITGDGYLNPNKITSIKVRGDLIVLGDFTIAHAVDNALEIGGNLIVKGNLTLNKIAAGGASKGLWVGGSIQVGGNMIMKDTIQYLRVGYRGQAEDGYIRCGGSFSFVNSNSNLHNDVPSQWSDAGGNPLTEMNYITKDLVARDVIFNGDFTKLQIRGNVFAQNDIWIRNATTFLVGKSMLAGGNIDFGEQAERVEVNRYLLAKKQLTIPNLTNGQYFRVKKQMAGGSGVSFRASNKSYQNVDVNNNLFGGFSAERIWSGGTVPLSANHTPFRGMILFGDAGTNQVVTQTVSGANQWASIDVEVH